LWVPSKTIYRLPSFNFFVANDKVMRNTYVSDALIFDHTYYILQQNFSKWKTGA